MRPVCLLLSTLASTLAAPRTINSARGDNTLNLLWQKTAANTFIVIGDSNWSTIYGAVCASAISIGKTHFAVLGEGKGPTQVVVGGSKYAIGAEDMECSIVEDVPGRMSLSCLVPWSSTEALIPIPMDDVPMC